MKNILVPFACGLAGVMAGSLLVGGQNAPAFAQDDTPTRMGHLVVERLDIVEPDGTLRQALYSKARDPGVVVRGKNYDHPSRTQSGMLFYNNEGTEVGGLVYAGRTKADGTPSSGGSLTFDAYEQDQIVQLVGVKEGEMQYSGVFVTDRPAKALDFELMDKLANETDEERLRKLIDRFGATDGGAPRGFFGRASNGDSTVVLRDAEGRKRLVLSVAGSGEARIAFLDENGEVLRTIEGAD